ncbi:aldehyde dehydrogenase family protein [Sedimentitalea sp. XS_ASV28]|uniref:aldehyde dehydrogenase family protein n=1 Tax=Sedimentitalea sp. XS_ASV28 TaxID=3241296 RepID=UPI003512118E
MSVFDNPNAQKFYIGGSWVATADASDIIVVDNPNTGAELAHVPAGTLADTDAAIAAARSAFAAWSQTAPAARADLLDAIGAEMDRRRADLIDAVCAEMGCPRHLTERFHVAIGIGIWGKTAQTVRDFPWDRQMGGAQVLREPLGVVGVLTPWNGPVTSVAKKLAAVLGAGCTAVSKPSEHTPFSAILVAEAIEAAGVPAGVVNMVQGYGATVGAHIVAHKDVDAITLTGSVGAGVAISRAGASNLKRMCLELGGKSANIILDDDGFAGAVKTGTIATMLNTGQVCFAPTRMLVPRHRAAEAEAIAKAVADGLKVGPADAEGVMMGPLVSAEQYERVGDYIRIGQNEARLVAGGPGRPEGLKSGHFVRPTVFADVTNDMRIAREEIFGPVLSILTYDDLDQAVEIANDSPFGLAAHISGQDSAQVASLARRLRAGSVYVNGATMSFDAPFGGYKMSGQGREHGEMGLEEFLETKSIVGL